MVFNMLKVGSGILLHMFWPARVVSQVGFSYRFIAKWCFTACNPRSAENSTLLPKSLILLCSNLSFFFHPSPLNHNEVFYQLRAPKWSPCSHQRQSRTCTPESASDERMPLGLDTGRWCMSARILRSSWHTHIDRSIWQQHFASITNTGRGQESCRTSC
jgi:hypothetical protein